MRSSGSKRWGRLAVIMLLVLAALVIAAPAALAANEGAIQGTLHQGGGALAPTPGGPVVNAYVYLYTNPAADPVDWTMSDATGYFEFPFVAGNTTYYLEYRETPDGTNDHIRSGAWVPCWYNSPYLGAPVADAGNATSVYSPIAANTVPDPVFVGWNTTVNVGAQVVTYRDTISGVVTNATPAPISGVKVFVWDSAYHPGYADEGAWLEAIWAGAVQADAVTSATGAYTVTGLLPNSGLNANARYKLFFYPPGMPNAAYAPEWYNDFAFNDWGVATAILAPWNTDMVGYNATLEPPVLGAIYGAVDQLNGWTGDREDAVGVRVELYDNNGNYVTYTTTGYGGEYHFAGVIPGFYKVKFVGPQDVGGDFWADYYDSWYTTPVTPGAPFQADNFDDAAWVQVNPGADTHGIWGLLYPIADIYRFVHAPYGVNDGPDRFETTVQFMGWGLHSVTSVNLVKDTSPFFTIRRLDWGVNDDGTGWITLNLASPKAPEGSYDLVYESWTPPWYTIDAELPGFQVVSSWVPTVPATPPSPTQPTPTTPTTPTPPVVTPTPEPSTPAAPVAGPVSVTASKASVKKGALATLRFQVDEAVLGGTADVKVIVTNKAGKVVKQVKAKVTMNAAASISFRCKLAKGVYSYTVSASGATASSTLTVR